MTKARDKGSFKNERSVRHAQVHLHLLCKHTFLLLFCIVIPLLHARTNFLSAHLSLLCSLHWPDVCVIKFIRTCSLLISPPCLSYMIVTHACLSTSHPIPHFSFFFSVSADLLTISQPCKHLVYTIVCGSVTQ